jgi:hypothetical protein
MTKRFLLIVALGVAFAPAVFAAEGEVYPNISVCDTSTGQDGACQTARFVGPGTQCDKQKAYNDMVADNIAHGYTASGAKP